MAKIQHYSAPLFVPQMERLKTKSGKTNAKDAITWAIEFALNEVD